MKARDGATRATYSVRLNPGLLKLLKHIAVDENRSVGELLEEGIRAVIKKRKIAISHMVDQKGMKSKSESADIDDDKYDIPEFLKKQPD
jgi:hypothetical protein